MLFFGRPYRPQYEYSPSARLYVRLYHTGTQLKNKTGVEKWCERFTEHAAVTDVPIISSKKSIKGQGQGLGCAVQCIAIGGRLHNVGTGLTYFSTVSFILSLTCLVSLTI